MSLAKTINSFNRELNFSGSLPNKIQIMNPFKENPNIIGVAESFYNKYYNDSNERFLILGINPGRHGAGVTGIPFTDTIRLEKYCGLKIDEVHSYETSSEFIYNMIEAYGGVNKFYSRYYISAVCPLGFTKTNYLGKEVNFNYYDNNRLLMTIYEFIVAALKKQLTFGINTDICYCLGTGKNFKFLFGLNKKENLFGEIIPLEHPRFIMQYKRNELPDYIDKYLRFLK